MSLRSAASSLVNPFASISQTALANQAALHSAIVAQQSAVAAAASSPFAAGVLPAAIAAKNFAAAVASSSSSSSVVGQQTMPNTQTTTNAPQTPSTTIITVPSVLEQHAHRLAAQSIQHHHSTGWCLFIYNLAPEIEEGALWKMFGPFGAVQDVNLVKDPQTAKCKGFAFVTMTDYNQALMAIQALNGTLLANRILQVSFKTTKIRKTMK